jgi:D-inositol-3-phosphate glycosyltransferase
MARTALTIAMISMHSSPLGRLGTPDTGGMSVYLRELAREMGRRGHRVDIFTRGESDGVDTISENVRLVSLAAGNSRLPKTALYPHVPAFFDALERFHSADGRSYDLIHSHYWLSGAAGELARRAWGVPHIITFHTLGEMKIRVCGPGSETKERLRTERELAVVCDRVLLTSVREKGNLLRVTPARADAVAIAPCGVNLELFRPIPKPAARRSLGLPPEESILLYVGRIAPEKGLDRLIEAVARIERRPHPRVVIVGGEGGGDPGLRRVKALTRHLGVSERIRFVGRVEQTELPTFYNAADLLVLPSSYESFGMVALEALACGTRVVATPVGAMEAFLREGENGRIARDFSASALARAVTRALCDAERQPAAAETVRRSALRFSWHRVAAEVLRVYRRMPASSAPDRLHPEGEPHPHAEETACCGCGGYAAAGTRG